MRAWLKNAGHIILEAMLGVQADDMDAHNVAPSDRFIIIPASVLRKLTPTRRSEVMHMAHQLERLTASEYPGHWFQVILRRRNGRFRSHPRTLDHQEKLGLKD